MTQKMISIVKHFHPAPYGRNEDDGEYNGKRFREDLLVPALTEYDFVHIDLTGYNRYGRSFLDEAFGGLVRESGFSGEEVQRKLTYSHDLVKSIEKVIQDRIEASIRDSMPGD